MKQAGGPNESGSAIWSLDVSSSGDRVVFGSGYPEMSIVCLHGKGKKEFIHPTGGIPGAMRIMRSRGEIVAGMVARRGLGNIVCLDPRGRQKWQITTHKKIENIDVTAEGDVICGTKDGTLLYLDKGGKVAWHKNLGLYKGPLSVFFIAQGVLGVTSKGGAFLFDRTGNTLNKQDLGAFVNKLAVCQKGFIAASLGSSRSIYFLDADAKVQFIKELEEPISALCVSSKGNFVLSGTAQGSVHLFSKTGRLLFSHKMATRVNCLAISESERYFAVGTNDFYVYFFNMKGELYWVYKTGANDEEAFSKQWPPDTTDLKGGSAQENRPAPSRQDAAPIEALARLLRKPEPEIISQKKGRSKGAVGGGGKEPAEPAPEPEPPEGRAVERKGVVIRHWVDFKDVAAPLYLIKIENHLDVALDTLEVIPRTSTGTFSITPNFKEFQELGPNRALLLKFALGPARDSQAFEDTRLTCDVNYIEPVTHRLVAVKPYDLMVPFTIPQIQLASPQERNTAQWGDFSGARIRHELHLTKGEISDILKDFMGARNIPFSKEEAGGKDIYTIFGKDYRGRLLMVELAIEDYRKGYAKVVVDLRTQSEKLLPPLYYLVQNLLGETLKAGPSTQGDRGDEFEPVDEECEVEWIDDEGDALEGLRHITGGPDGLQAPGGGGGEDWTGQQERRYIGPSRLDPHAFYLMDYQDRRWLLKLITSSLPILNRCLLLSRVYPLKFKEMYEYDPDAIEVRWISGMGKEGAFKPDDTKRFLSEAAKFLDKNPRGLIVLDGLDYILNSVDFATAYELVSNLRDLTALKDGALLVCLNLGALSDTEVTQLKKEADGVITA